MEELNAAIASNDTEAIIGIAAGKLRNDIVALEKAAWALRNRMAYAEAIEVCDRMLALDAQNVAAREIKALCIARQSPDEREKAMKLLEEAIELTTEARGSEASALLGSLYKEIWRTSWFHNIGRVSARRVAHNKAKACRDIRHLKKALTYYCRQYDRDGAYYACLNAVAVMTLAEHLGLPFIEKGKGQVDIRAFITDTSLASTIDEEIKGSTNTEDAYWAHVSRAELGLILAELDEKAFLEDYRSAAKLAVPCFHLDSTMQQLRMYRELGYKPALTVAALEVLEGEWDERKKTGITPKDMNAGSADRDAPPWLLDLFELLTAKGDTELKRIWGGYRSNKKALDMLGRLAVKWEPVQQLTPRHANPPTLGFELLGMNVDGVSYYDLKKEWIRAGFSPVDLDLALFALDLRLIRSLRGLIQSRLGYESLRLYYSVNFDHDMLESKALRIILKHYNEYAANPFSDSDSRHGASAVYFEISEKFPKIPTGSTQEMIKKITDKACEDLFQLVTSYNMALMLDDANDMKPIIRAKLASHADKIKADYKYTRYVLDEACVKGPADKLDLFKYVYDAAKPFVIEGVETVSDYDCLQHNWKYHNTTYIQGWYVKVDPLLLEFFEPLHDDPDQPRGYRLKASVEDKLGLS